MGIASKIRRLFHGGVHPPEYKDLSENCGIEAMPMPERLFVPLHQHIGAPCDPCVSVGDKVLKGQVIGKPAGFVSSPVHAPTSGTIVDIKEHTVGHPSGLTMLCAIIDTDGADTWLDTLKGIDDPMNAEPSSLRDQIRNAGIVGLGGATFPTFIKLSPPKGKVAELLLINGVECEPYLTCDARLMEEQTERVIDGIHLTLHALQTKKCIIGIENNKPRAIEAMQKAVADEPNITVQALPVMYPQGGEKQLIEAVTKKQVPSGGLPVDVGVIVHNVATIAAISDAIRDGKPLINRLVTVSGLGINRPANVDALFGTPVQSLIDHCGGLKQETKRVVMGGPMMGVTLHYMEAPVTKGTSGLLAMTAKEAHEEQERPCIRCGSCLQACPVSLMPTEMAWFSRTEQFDMAKDYNLYDCIECGSCAYVCPSNIPLVHYFRFAKLSIGAAEREARQAEISKKRTKIKDARVVKEQEARAAKKAAMKAKMAAKRKASASATKKPAATDSTAAGDDKAAKAARAAKAAQAAKAARAKKAAASGDAGGDDDKAAKAARAAKAAKAARAAKAAKAARAAKAAKAATEQSE
ncbi:MAG: electron transport complex subunit RsxC [Magnetococcales bacterium]|nr:electron transport complex subunit RsxC [Magnetococcales bacterium]